MAQKKKKKKGKNQKPKLKVSFRKKKKSDFSKRKIKKTFLVKKNKKTKKKKRDKKNLLKKKGNLKNSKTPKKKLYRTGKSKKIKKKGTKIKKAKPLKAGKTKTEIRKQKRIEREKKTEKKTKKEEKILEFSHNPKIRVIGVGGGGGAIVSEIANRVKKADFYSANTDTRALMGLSGKVKKFQFGKTITNGLGTGMNIEAGERAALEEKDRIKKILEGKDLCILIACLGGGTSSGAGPIFAKISRELGNLTYGIFTLPFEFEGEKKMQSAIESLEKIRTGLNIYSVIPNEKIFEIVDKKTPLKEALSVINKKLAENLESLIETVYLPGLINIDFADLKTTFAGRANLCYLNSVEIKKEEKENKELMVKKLIYSPLYPYSLKGAKAVLYNIIGGKDIQLAEVTEISEIISQYVNKEAKIIFGVKQDQKYNNKIKITILAVGCSGREFFAEIKKKKNGEKNNAVSLNEIKENFSLSEKEKKTSLVQVPFLRKKKKRKKVKPEKKGVGKTEEKNKKQVSASKKKATVKKQEKEKTVSGIIKPKSKNEKKTEKKEKALLDISKEKEKKEESIDIVLPKIRKNALEVKKQIEEEEKRLLEKEKAWEIPAIFRLKKKDEENN